MSGQTHYRSTLSELTNKKLRPSAQRLWRSREYWNVIICIIIKTIGAILFSSFAQNRKKETNTRGRKIVRVVRRVRWVRRGRQGGSMKNSSGAIGAAKAPPYLVSHRRIINVIRIMYPRNSDRQGSPAGLRRKKGGGIGNCGGRDAYLCCGIYRRGTKPARGKRGGDGKGRGAVRVQRERRRCPHDRSPRQGRIFSLLYPGAAIPAIWCAKSTYFAFATFYAYSKKRSAALVSQLKYTCRPRFLARYKSKKGTWKIQSYV